MDIFVTKILILILFMVLTTSAALLPWIMKKIAGGDDPQRRARVQRLLTSLNYVAGGVFIGTILLHLVPEVHDGMTEALITYEIETAYPVPELVIGIGLLLFVLIEQVVLVFQGDSNHDDNETISLTDENGAPSQANKHDNEIHEAHLLQTTSMVRSYALLIALSLHSIFEGMVVGLQKRSSPLWELFVAIVIHKVLVAFGLGSRLLTSRHNISIVHYAGMILVFASMTPLGGIIGTVVSANPDHSPGMALVQAILVGLATGSFMFVVFFEIIRFDGGHKANLFMCLLVICGFMTIALVITVHSSEHDHIEVND